MTMATTNAKSKRPAPGAKQRELMRLQGYLTVAEAAARLGRHAGTVYAAIKEGRLPAARVGNSYYVSLPALAAYAGPEGAAALGLAPAGKRP